MGLMCQSYSDKINHNEGITLRNLTMYLTSAFVIWFITVAYLQFFSYSFNIKWWKRRIKYIVFYFQYVITLVAFVDNYSYAQTWTALYVEVYFTTNLQGFTNIFFPFSWCLLFCFGCYTSVWSALIGILCWTLALRYGTWNVFDRLSTFMKIGPVGAELFHVHRRTDTNDEIDSHFL